MYTHLHFNVHTLQCKHNYTSIYTHLHFNVHKLTLQCTHTYTSRYTQLHFNVHTITLQCTHIYTSMYTHFNVNTITLQYTHIYTSMYTHTSMWTHLHFNVHTQSIAELNKTNLSPLGILRYWILFILLHIRTKTMYFSIQCFPIPQQVLLFEAVRASKFVLLV
jgi:hypothetical protein